MNVTGRLFSSSIGRKFLMALTGLVLIGFVIGHLVGNLQIFQAPDHINGYAHFLHGLGPLLWVARIGLLVCLVIHVWAATVLTLEDRAARGAQPYAKERWLRAAVTSRYMRLSGYVVLAFIVYHLAQFTVGVGGRFTETASFKENLPLYTMQSDYHVAGVPVVHAGAQVLDVHSMVILGFQNPIVSLFYIIAVGLLAMHLRHGSDSLFQTLGWRSGRWANGLRRVTLAFAILYFIGNLIIPGAVLTGMKGLRPGYHPPLTQTALHR
ncbi:succinate dehydrogenase cytochrome b subunit [Horticoccus luteus]|uniref:Succinate dehydrogenase cytochrome b subunit n=1 Tax=Horticoccus luteus TaxID=2862869 RepID=A0A8F9TXE2_9BACT|nr:succinate dehydrogenase cytochrome b subunit [Horticoccus luteus]QYM79292.1 succinate dehydrogenase cytochrome b subunit [Horticoccus luteus]